MKTNDTRIALSGILPILAIVCAGFLTATAASGETYREAMQEAERESIHQNERVNDPRREAIEEAERESPHERELQQRANNPLDEALEENKRERP